MKILTWNVNSIRTRLERLLGVLNRHQPDIVCLQELKTTEDKFPFEEISSAGYHTAMYGQKTYNGVALLSKEEPQEVQRGFGSEDEDPQARLIAATINNIRVISAYFPNGNTVGSEKYDYKIAWMQRLLELVKTSYHADQPLLICGDTNIAINDQDAANPEQWADSVLCAPPGREALSKLLAWGLVDVFAEKYPEGGQFSWWDYRQLAFPKGDGLRIDHILATRPLADKCTAATIDRDERKGKQPSDHAPVIAEFAV